MMDRTNGTVTTIYIPDGTFVTPAEAQQTPYTSSHAANGFDVTGVGSIEAGTGTFTGSFVVDLLTNVNDVVFTLSTNYGAKNNRVKAQGLTNAEIEIYNVTDMIAPSLASLTEVNGTYTATFTSPQDLTDVVRVQGVSSTVQKGYDLKLVDDVTTVIA